MEDWERFFLLVFCCVFVSIVHRRETRRALADDPHAYRTLFLRDLRVRGDFEVTIQRAVILKVDRQVAILWWTGSARQREGLVFDPATSNHISFVDSFHEGQRCILPRSLLEFERTNSTTLSE